MCRILDQLPNAGSQCQVRSVLPVDMIYTDIVGLIQFKRKVRSGYAKFRCELACSLILIAVTVVVHDGLQMPFPRYVLQFDFGSLHCVIVTFKALIGSDVAPRWSETDDRV